MTHNCLFCQIVARTIPSHLIYETVDAVVVLDAFPLSLGHALVISKKHYPDFSHTDPLVLATISRMAQKTTNIIREHCPEIVGFNYLFNEGKLAGQSVFHTHLHVIPKYSDGTGFTFVEGKKSTKIDQTALFNKIQSKNHD